jgi:hypothetical protein
MGPPPEIVNEKITTPPSISSGDMKQPTSSTIDGLAQALAGVGLGGSNTVSSATATTSNNPFATSNGNNHVDDGWGNFTEITENEVTEKIHMRNESIDLFLSKSPSQTLGEDVFKFSHPNLPSLAEEASQPEVPVQEFFPKAVGTQQIRQRRTDSPSCSVTGTTTSSRSISPYNNDANRGPNNIPAYLDSSAPASLHPVTSHPSLSGMERSPYNKSPAIQRPPSQPLVGTQSYQLPVEQAQSSLTMPSLGTGQVLYMAVPSPDGRGQVLQPVQMMQLPGKPFTYVVPQDLAPNAMNGNGGIVQPDPIAMTGLASPPVSLNEFGTDRTYDDPLYKNSNLPPQTSGPQYQSDPAIASLYSAPQRPPLEQLLGQVRRLSRDQVGCRLVQQALDEEGPMAATLILNEGLPFWGEAMVDPFGNYLFQKILEKVTPEERIMLIKTVSPRLVNASLNLHGTRSVQKVVELCAQDENEKVDGESAANILTNSLAPAAARLCIDSHGNHVIQRILLRLQHHHAKFIFDAVAASVGDVARHRHGCCVIQRCLDSPPSEARAHLVRRIVEKSLELMQDAYGNYVVQYVLDVCSDEDVHAVCESVAGKVNLLAIQKFSSNVMEKCLERCSDRVKEMYLAEISDSERIRELMMDPFGNYVVQRALSVATHSQAIRLVEAMRPHLMATQTINGQRNGGVRNTAGGRRIIAKICRRFPNFTLNPVGSPDELYSQNKGNHRYLNHHQQGGNHQLHAPKQNYAYASAPPSMLQQQLYTDPRLSHQPLAPPVQQPQQQVYGLGGIVGASNALYYDPFAEGGLGGYPGM